MMDLLHHQRIDLAWRFLNTWLEATGDHAGIRCCASICLPGDGARQGQRYRAAQAGLSQREQ